MVPPCTAKQPKHLLASTWRVTRHTTAPHPAPLTRLHTWREPGNEHTHLPITRPCRRSLSTPCCAVSAAVLVSEDGLSLKEEAVQGGLSMPTNVSRDVAKLEGRTLYEQLQVPRWVGDRGSGTEWGGCVCATPLCTACFCRAVQSPPGRLHALTQP